MLMLTLVELCSLDDPLIRIQYFNDCRLTYKLSVLGTTTTTTSTSYCSSYNPCYMLELGRRAFLKCLGLDDSSTTSQDSSLPNGNNGQGKLTKRDKSQ
ncbi:hypothetical protein MKW94_023196 [Papaver nudicaule]|uniref:Uncharacterized protein n=1 Tax=Papaver nudicaule TaxID=74823 RepID=A0AA41W014_PAPNU|nr:hypothetical protein [Papaver nudicaule]